MAQKLNFNWFWTVTVGGVTHSYNTTDTAATEITLTSDVIKNDRRALGNNITWDAWGFSSDTDAMGAFNFLQIMADTEIKIELAVNKSGVSFSTSLIPIIQPANRPLILHEDDGLAGYANDFASGSTRQIDRIRVRNESGGTSNVWLFMAG
jgi:hypothetical protein